MIRRFLFIALLLFILIFFHKEKVMFLIYGGSGADVEAIDEVTQSNVSIGYLLHASRWTSFSISGNRDFLRVITNASIPKREDFDPEFRFWYAIQYQILDDKQNPLVDRTYHFHSTLTPFVDEATGKKTHPKFYLNRFLMPADLKLMLVNLTALKEYRFIRFRLHSMDPVVNDVMIRVYAKKKLSRVKAASLWHRLSSQKKKNMTRGNVYHHDFISEKEKVNLLSNRWEPIGPSGVKDEDYQSRRLYVFKDTEGYSVDDPLFPKGLWMDRFHYVTIPIPSSDIPFVFEIELVEKSEPSLKKKIVFEWYGEKSHERFSKTVPLFFPETRITETLKPGLVRIISEHKAVVRVFLDDINQKEVTPELKYLRLFTLSNDLPVTYDIIHENQKPTPFRADFRYDSAPDIPPFLKTVRYELLDKKGGLIASGRFDCSSPPSFYERFPGDFSPNRITEKVSRYFLFPLNVRRVRFFAEKGIWITAYNRPDDLVKRTRVPDDYKTFQGEDQLREPTWFSLHPVDYKNHIKTGRTLSVHTQTRPPDSPPLDQSSYEWELYLPAPPWQGRYLLTHHDNATPFRKEQLSSLFQEIPINRNFSLTFLSPVKGKTVLNPQLVFIRSDDDPRRLSVTLNKKKYFSDRIIGKRGMITLPDISTGTYRIRLSIKATGSFFLNYAGKGSENRLKRLVFKIPPEGLVFQYPKNNKEPEVLLLRYYALPQKTSVTRLFASIQNKMIPDMAPKTAFTPLNREFTLQPNSKDPPSIVLHHPDRFLDGGQLMFLPLDQDLPTGNLMVHIRTEGEESGYVILSKITMGTFEKRYFFKERGMSTP